VANLQRVVDALFDALLERAKHVLVALRDTPDDPDAVRRWAFDHGLECDLFVVQAVEMRSWWTSHPRAAEHMRRHWINAVAVYRQEGDDEKTHRAALLRDDLTLPQHGESQAAWLRRAKQIHAELSVYSSPIRRRMPPRSHEVERHVRWFVDVHVLGLRPTEVAKRAKVDRAAVERATKNIAEGLGVARRRFPRGRPQKRPETS
jgi:hypothetical protein